MLNEITKSDIIDNRFAFSKDEVVKVNALDLCDELIKSEALKRAYNTLLASSQRLQAKYDALVLSEPIITTVNLRV